MKSIAASKAKSRWPDATVSFEQTIGDRRTDVLVAFDERHHRYGRGIAIEVQYQHRGKDERAVEDKFLSHEYSTLWLREDHYDGKDVALEDGEWAVWWAHSVPDQSDWSGLHGVVHWLYQEQSPPVQIEISIPREYDEWVESLLREVWRRAQNDAWETLVEAQLGSGGYLYLSKAPSDNMFLQLAKMDYTGRQSVHAPIQVATSNANKLHYFARHIAELYEEHGGFVDESAESWETEQEVWLYSWSNRIKSLIKTVRTPSGELAIELKKIENGDFESVTVAASGRPSTIDALHQFADGLASVAESSNT